MNEIETELIFDDLVFPECLRWRQGRLWFVDMYAGKLMSIVPGQTSVLHREQDTIFGGIGWLPDDRLILCDKTQREIIGPDGTHHADLSQFHDAPINDLISLPDGTAFVGEYGFNPAAGEKFARSNLYRVRPDGQCDIAADGLAFPNGMVLSADRRILFVAESYARQITRLEVHEDGTLSGRKTLVRFPEGGPDGISIDSSGNIWASLVGPKSVVRVTPEGQIDRNLSFSDQPYDVEVGENDSELFVATSGADFADLVAPPLPRLGKILRVRI
ncbi:Sugar lactone lactonase YvrE [Parasphingorhabdus marina DSM 22363]|uniref:Sugar lactone lactonase YvrE n=1 Tax=Parasphingorhabdus marina DSM 22363 TaxID=1123272 RepID=A0A1N6D1D7_9SPHN|nr:SMP-30/gluconolactonase/LRE family protein [Parasphingorhabdus marina]SIN64620.1 Sugar lactone lactonase YvrE [Parasphingorhabdus marina DSM 22363]